jgi:hypothetical protein
MVICVLGMHRSGTSCLTGILQESGVVLGNVFTSNRANRKGNREHPLIMQLHEEILRQNGAGWDEPPTGPVTWSAKDRQARDEVCSSFKDVPCWGFKDPRTLFTLPGWLEAIPDLRLVGIFRHPMAVAASLERRNGFSISKALSLWNRYNERLLSYYDQYHFPLLCFDLPEDQFHASTRQVLVTIGLEAGANSFFDKSLRHHLELQHQPIPDVQAVLYYERLLTIFRAQSESNYG